jgi:hypothetical protein
MQTSFKSAGRPVPASSSAAPQGHPATWNPQHAADLLPAARHSVARYGNTRHWAVRDPAGELVCVAVYLRGAREAATRLDASSTTGSREGSRS